MTVTHIEPILGTRMEAEIREQPRVFERILTQNVLEVKQVVSFIRRKDPRMVLLVARGSSDNAALYAKYLVETQLGLPCGLWSPSTVTIYDSRPRLDQALVIAFSQSGGSEDIAQSIRRARECGAVTLAITNAGDSILQREAELHLPLLTGEEQAIAATKTYTAELLVALMLVTTLGDENDVGVESLPELAAETMERGSAAIQIASHYRSAEHMLLTSRGYNYATAQEGALKLIETANLPAHSFSGADLMHGPVAMVDAGFPVIVVLPPGPTGDSMTPILEALADRCADMLLIGSDEGQRFVSAHLLSVPQSPEILSPLLMIIPIQFLALHLSRNRGIDADRPIGLSKVTSTV